MSAIRFEVDKQSPVPLWYQIRQAILSRIISGAWEPGVQLPPETELRDALDVSRSTVRAAIQSLVQDGLVTRTQGRGSFVASSPITEMRAGPMGFYRTMTARGHTVRSKVLELDVIPASGELMQELNVRPGEDILMVQRLRYLDDSPVVLSINYLVHRLCRGIEDEDLSEGSLWARVEEIAGRQVAGGLHTFKAVLPTDEERELLELPPETPLLTSYGTNYLTDGTPLERSQMKMSGDRGFLQVRYITKEVAPSFFEDTRVSEPVT